MLGTLRDERPALERMLMLAEFGRQRCDSLVQRKRLLVQRIGFIRDRPQETNPFDPEEPPVGRLHEPVCELDGLTIRRTDVTDGLAQAPADAALDAILGPLVTQAILARPLVRLPPSARPTQDEAFEIELEHAILLP